MDNKNRPSTGTIVEGAKMVEQIVVGVVTAVVIGLILYWAIGG